MKPVKVLLFQLIVFSLLAFLILIFPKNGIKISKNISLYFTNFNELFSLKKTTYADISAIANDPLDSTKAIVNIDSLFNDTAKASSNALLKNIRKIEYPNNDPSVLYPVFQTLSKLKDSKELIRILHYGDSQIEGDRITGFLRFKLQSKFGGNGVGLMPLMNPTASASLQTSNSDDWIKYTLIGKSGPHIHQMRYGAMLSFARFAPAVKDSTYTDTTYFKGNLYMSKSTQGYSNTRDFQKLRLFYGFNKKDVKLNLSANKELLTSEILPQNQDLKVFEYNFKTSPSSMTIQLKGKDSPDVYGFSLDAENGVAVDNIPLRGSSGYGFSQMNFSFLKKFYDLLNVKLVIMQFGVNAVPEDEKTIIPDYNYYERGFYSQLKTIKEINKDICIIVIGISDRSRKSGDSYETNPNIEKIIKAQKNAAFRAGCAYWDLFEAMGGQNSMPSWVFAKPALANKDFTHFNEKGARMVAEMFYNALIYDYLQYLKLSQSNNSKLSLNK
ncbi:MAG: GDSL-type esterase/lipase family protein [Bacteroidetes bacterium]|nr:GDSL-type esterase/lipase family protein [Bacteroidota bacterium]